MSTRRDHHSTGRVGAAGFTLTECLIALVILSFGLLGILGMFGTAYSTVAKSGGATGVDATILQTMEDIRNLPFPNVMNLNGVTTARAASAPPNDPERTVARKFKYWLNGNDALWGFSGNEIQTKLSTTGGTPSTDPAAVGTITVTDVTPGFPARTNALYRVTVAIAAAGINTAVTQNTYISRCTSTVPGNPDVACP